MVRTLEIGVRGEKRVVEIEKEEWVDCGRIGFIIRLTGRQVEDELRFGTFTAGGRSMKKAMRNLANVIKDSDEWAE